MSLLQPSASCGVQECSKSELPPGLAHPEVSADCSEEDDNGSAVDDSLSEEAIRDLRDWKDHDDSQVGGFCEVDGANSDKYCMTINFELFVFFYIGHRDNLFDYFFTLWTTMDRYSVSLKGVLIKKR